MTKRVLFIKPFYDAWPVGIAYVIGALTEGGYSVDLVDCSISLDWHKVILDKVKTRRYLAVLSGGLLLHADFFKSVSDLMSSMLLDIPFVLGGNIVKDAPNWLLFDYIGITYGVAGEGEIAVLVLLDSLAKSNVDHNVPGLVYKKDGDVVRNRAERIDLTKINILPAWDAFDVGFYIRNSRAPFVGMGLKFMPVLTGRGCTGRCAFCSPSIGGFMKRSVEFVVSEMLMMAKKYSFSRFFFYNEMFYQDKDDILFFCELYAKAGVPKPWMAAIRIDSDLDVQTLKIMKHAGCEVLSAGIESGSDEVLHLMNKKIKSVDIRNFFANAAQAGMPVNGTVMIGSEGETADDIRRTFSMLIDLGANSGESLMYCYPGTGAYRRAVKNGMIGDEMAYLSAKLEHGAVSLFDQNMRSSWLNLTAMQLGDFIRVASHEVRRYNTWLFREHLLRDLTARLSIGYSGVMSSVSGICSCGHKNDVSYAVFSWDALYQGLLYNSVSDDNVCQNCWRRFSYNVYLAHLPGVKRHYLRLSSRLKDFERVLVVGINEDAVSILRVDYFGLNYDKVCAFLDESSAPPLTYISQYPVYRELDDAMLSHPDCILFLDPRSCWKVKRRIKSFCRDARRKPPYMMLYMPAWLMWMFSALSLLNIINPLRLLRSNLTVKKFFKSILKKKNHSTD